MPHKKNDPLETDLNGWALWLIRDRSSSSIGWPRVSPIVNFGMPRGSSWGTDVIWQATSDDWHKFDRSVRRLGDGNYALLRVYYVDYGGNRLSEYARHCSMDKSNLRRLMEFLKHRLKGFLIDESQPIDKVA